MGRKYLFVINSFLAGGAERSLLELLPCLVDSGVTPMIACLNYREVGFEEDVRAAGYDVRLLSGRGRMAKIRSLRRIIKQERPDLVYTSLFDADLAGRIAAIGVDVPVISNLANTAYDPARLADPNIDARRLKLVQLVDGWTSRHLTDHFHAVSQAVKDSTVATLKVDPRRITVVKREGTTIGSAIALPTVVRPHGRRSGSTPTQRSSQRLGARSIRRGIAISSKHLQVWWQTAQTPGC